MSHGTHDVTHATSILIVFFFFFAMFFFPGPERMFQRRSGSPKAVFFTEKYTLTH